MAELTLHNPDYLSLDDAYRGLSRLHYLFIQTDLLDQVLSDMCKIGFVAIEMVEMDEERGQYTLKASKGKHGPCKFKGATATYSGVALAALDDDMHLFPVNVSLPICDKTRTILQLPAYRNQIRISDSEEVNESNNAMQLDFEAAIEHVQGQIGNVDLRNTDRIMAFYPGPFRLLILNDGTLVWRGKWNNVSEDLLQQSRQQDNLLFNNEIELKEATYLQQLISEKGSAALLGDMPALEKEVVEYETNFESLKEVKGPLRGRLLDMITGNRKYFLLVGNEMSDTFGCCPSEEVTEANKLVKGGILDSFSEPVTGEACPVTLYAFRNEMRLSEDGLSGKPDVAFRDEVLAHLKRQYHAMLHLVIKWILIAFVTVSLLLSMRNCYQQQFGDAVTQVTYERINPENKFQAVLVLFHNQKRCFQCLEMEKLSHDLLGQTFDKMDAPRSIGFSTFVIDDPASLELVEQFGIFAATLVLIDYSDHENPVGKVLTRAPELYRDRDAFRQYLETELETFMD